MNRPPAFLLYVKDWLSSKKISRMSIYEEHAYFHLILCCWDSDDCTLPDDDAELAQYSGLSARQWKKSEKKVRECFTPHANKPGRLVNLRLYQEWENLMARREERSHAGRKGAETRWKPENDTGSADGSAIAQPSSTGAFSSGADNSSAIHQLMAKHAISIPIPNSSPSSNEDTQDQEGSVRGENTPASPTPECVFGVSLQEKSAAIGENQAFEQVYVAYPGKSGGKVAARKAWAKAKGRPTVELLLAAIEQQKKSKRWAEGFIPHFSTWLNQGRWTDQLPEKPRARLPL